ncbi:hypothetical protein AB0M46_37725 [Dactylosporangium sp. NPDC051485]
MDRDRALLSGVLAVTSRARTIDPAGVGRAAGPPGGAGAAGRYEVVP